MKRALLFLLWTVPALHFAVPLRAQEGATQGLMLSVRAFLVCRQAHGALRRRFRPSVGDTLGEAFLLLLLFGSGQRVLEEKLCFT